MTTVLYHYAVTSLHKLITKTDLCLWDLILVFGIWSLYLESNPCIWDHLGIFVGWCLHVRSVLLLVHMSDVLMAGVFFSSLFDPWLCAVIHSVFFSLCSLSLHSTHREKAGGVFKEGLQPAQTSLHSSFSGGKICCCHEETAVWWVILHINLLLFLRMLLTISHKKPTFNGRAQKNSYTCSF